jgi:hypothetical protein
MTLPRGLRNNNPLNLRKTTTTWKDEVNNPQEASFESFRTLAAGLRAGIKNAKTQWNRGKTTINTLVSVWAPPSENNTGAYVNTVAKAAGISKDKFIDWSDKNLVARIIHAMVIHENGAIANKYLPLAAVLTEVKAVG